MDTNLIALVRLFLWNCRSNAVLDTFKGRLRLDNRKKGRNQWTSPMFRNLIILKLHELLLSPIVC